MSRGKARATLPKEEIDILLKYFPKGIVALDIETTGLSPIADKVIELAAIKLGPDRAIDTWHNLINPERSIPEITFQYHQISEDMVKDKKTLESLLPEFLQFWNSLPVVAHNAQFDLGFLIRYLHLMNLSLPKVGIYDSCRVARTSIPKGEEEHKVDNYKLSTLANFFDIPLVHHQALDDALASLRILARSLLKLSAALIPSILENKAQVYHLSKFKKSLQSYKLPTSLQGLNEVIAQQKMIEIIYRGGRGHGPRVVRPISLLPMPQGLILYGECQETRLNKNYLIKKIESFKVLGE